jgi:hypothetical protein
MEDRMKWPDKPENGPDYPDLGPTVIKHRRKAKAGLGKLSADDRRAYGEAVEQAIRAKQRHEFIRASCEPDKRATCASGTWHNDGNKIDAAIKQQQRAALAAYPSQERRARTPEKWKELYEEAMEAKRNGKHAVPRKHNETATPRILPFKAPKTKNRRRK